MADELIMPFGKYHGVAISDLPSSYLRWLAENCRDETICEAADEEYTFRLGGRIICAWGNHGRHLARSDAVRDRIRHYRPQALKINKATGEPAHPLYLKNTLTPKVFR